MKTRTYSFTMHDFSKRECEECWARVLQTVLAFEKEVAARSEDERMRARDPEHDDR